MFGRLTAYMLLSIGLFVGVCSVDARHIESEHDSIVTILNSRNLAEGDRLKGLVNLISVSEADVNHEVILSKLAVEDKVQLADDLHVLGKALLQNLRYAESLNHLNLALDISESSGDSRMTVKILNSISALFVETHNPEQALNTLAASLKLSEHANDSAALVESLKRIGLVFDGQGDLSKAMDSYARCVEIQGHLGDLKGVAQSFVNIGLLYYQSGDDPNALEYYQRGFQLLEQSGDRLGMAACLNNVANVFHGMGDHQEAIRLYLKSLELGVDTSDVKATAVSLVNLGILHAGMNDFATAIAMGERSFSISQQFGGDYEVFISAEFLADMYETVGLHSLAIKTFKVYSSAKERISGRKHQKEVMRQQFQYDNEKRDAIATEQLRRKNQQRNAFIGGFALMLGLAGVSYRSYRIKKRDNGIITAQKEVVEKKNHAILESITYARQLQEAVLPPPKVVKELFADSFLLYMPRDIVSGDFYWMESISPSSGGGGGEVISYFAIGDCTGHGVPGAMLSVMGLNGLNRALNELRLTEPADMLTQLTKDLHDAFLRSDATVRDGMDLAICALDVANRKLTFAGANNPLWIARNGEMLVFKGNKRPVGFHDMEGEGFSQVEIDLHEGDIIYLATDGYQDQLGGPKGLKMMTKVFRSRLLELSSLPLMKQREQLISELNAWRGEVHQTDDVCMMGVRV